MLCVVFKIDPLNARKIWLRPTSIRTWWSPNIPFIATHSICLQINRNGRISNIYSFDRYFEPLSVCVYIRWQQAMVSNRLPLISKRVAHSYWPGSWSLWGDDEHVRSQLLGVTHVTLTFAILAFYLIYRIWSMADEKRQWPSYAMARF